MKFDNVIVSKKSHEDGDVYAIVRSNLTVVNLLRDEAVPDESVCDEALMSYWVDYYLAQCNNGGTSQFVYNTRWLPSIVENVRAGLERIAGPDSQQLALFRALEGRVASLGKAKLEAFFKGDYFGANEARDFLKDSSFFDVDKVEPLVVLNAKWLRGLPNLSVLDIDDMFAEIERTLGRTVSRS